MNFWEFIFNILALLVGGFVILGVIVSIWNYINLEALREKPPRL